MKAKPGIAISATPNTLTGSGTVTLTVTGAPEKVVPTCEGVTVTENEDGTFSATLPNESKTYTFVADYAGDDNHEAAKATCDVTVTYQSTSLARPPLWTCLKTAGTPTPLTLWPSGA